MAVLRGATTNAWCFVRTKVRMPVDRIKVLVTTFILFTSEHGGRVERRITYSQAGRTRSLKKAPVQAFCNVFSTVGIHITDIRQHNPLIHSTIISCLTKSASSLTSPNSSSAMETRCVPALSLPWYPCSRSPCPQFLTRCTKPSQKG